MTCRSLIPAIALGACLLASAPAAVAQTPATAVNPDNGELALVVDFEVKSGFESEFEAAFARSVRCSRLEPGNVAFNIHRVADAPGRYVLYEIWRSPAALESHFAQPYTEALFAMFDRALVRPVTEGGLRYVVELSPVKREDGPGAGSAARAECS